MEYTIDVVNLTGGFVITSQGMVIEVDQWLDCDGVDCEPDDAVVIVAGPDQNGQWVVIDIGSFEEVVLH